MERSRALRPSLVPSGRRFEGLVIFRGEACVEGEVRGVIEAQGCLRLGPDSRVKGPVSVDELELEGDLEGDVLARCSARLDAGATLRGTLSSPRVFVADGARIQGPCRIGSVSGESPESAASA